MDAIEADRDRRWLVERAAAVGNVLRHEYSRVAPDVIWAVAQEHLPELEKVCRAELARALDEDTTDQPGDPA